MKTIEVNVSTLATLHGLVDACKLNLAQLESAVRELDQKLSALKYDEEKVVK